MLKLKTREKQNGNRIYKKRWKETVHRKTGDTAKSVFRNR